jgi:C-terminal processing protease CtpA/Prc
MHHKNFTIIALKGFFLLFIVISLTGSNFPENKDYFETWDKKTEYLSAFAKLYGYIRYFHPSDEAASIDWNRFLYYGIEQVVKAQNPVDLKNILDSLFLPIAPNIDIFFAGEIPKVFDQPENIDGLALVTWQHRGVAANPHPMYKSIRLGRINWAFYSRFGIFQQSSNRFDCGNKKFKISTNVCTSNNGKGQIEILGNDPSTGKWFYRSGAFENEELEPFILEGEFGEGIGYLVLTIRLLKKGKILIDDFKFQLERNPGNLQPFSIRKSQFVTEVQGDIDDEWKSYGLGYKYNIAKSTNKSSIVLESSDEFEYNSLFKKHCLANELITKDLGSGIKCRFPLALYLAREQPKNFSKSFMDLKNTLSRIHLEWNSAELEVTRIGAVITAWNIFQHFYPYFDVVHADWEKILKQTLSEVQDNQNENDFLISLRKMTSALDDGHVKVMHPSERNLKALPVIFDYIEDQIVVVATNSDQLQKGDIILELDGKPAKQLLFNYEKIMSGSPQWKKQKALREFTKDDSAKISEVKIRRGEKVLEVPITRKLSHPQYDRPDNVTEFKNSIYYINLCKASMEEIENRIEDISKAKGVVFDLRGYPNSNHNVIRYMIDHPVQSAKWNPLEIIYPDQENIAGYDTSDRWTIEPKQPRIQGKVVFITNENAISYAESFMGIIDYYKLAEIVGSQTAGANGNVNTVTTLGGVRIQWTGEKTLKQDGSQHHLVGILPTIHMEPTIKGIREGRDELLEKAIEILSE